MPEKVLEKLNKKILPQWKACFFAALIIGLIAHIYKITNWLPNWDSLVFRYHSQNMLALGRWFLPVVCSFTSFYDLPFLNGILAILFHALGAVYILKILNIQKKTTAILIGAVVVSFPTVTSVMMYNYVADGYGISFFLSVLAAYFMTKEKPKFVLASVFIALSVAIYQAYLTVTVMLILLYLIDGLVFGDADFLSTVKKALFMLLSGAAGVLLYGIVLKILLAVFSVELLDYQGMGDTASLSLINIPASLYVIKETFINCFFDFSKGLNVFIVLNLFILIFTFAYYIKHIIVSKLYKKTLNLVLTVILGIILVLGAGVLAFVNPHVDYHNLMLMGYAVFYLFFLIIYERGSEKSEKGTYIKCWIVLIVSMLLISNQVVIANVSYHKAQISYEKSYGTLIRIADRIEQTSGSENCDKIMVIGALKDSESYSVTLPPDITGITDGYILRADDETVGQSVLSSALCDYCGKDYEFISGEQKRNLMLREEVKAMNEWPKENCVSVIDDIIVIKLYTEVEK